VVNGGRKEETMINYVWQLIISLTFGQVMLICMCLMIITILAWAVHKFEIKNM